MAALDVYAMANLLAETWSSISVHLESLFWPAIESNIHLSLSPVLFSTTSLEKYMAFKVVYSNLIRAFIF